MTKIIRQVVIVLFFCGIMTSLSSCGRRGRNTDPHFLRVGLEWGLEYDMAQVAQRIAREKYGLKVELVPFSDYIMPNVALNDGDIDANAFQHKPYLDGQSRERHYHFAIVGNTFVYPIAAYSRKIKSLRELPDGVTIVIPNDPTNEGRALLLMQKVGLIRLRDGVGILPKITDVTGNQRQLNIVELEAPQLARALDDNKVFLAIINSNFSAQVGLMAGRDGIFMEDKESPYVNIIVTREENKSDPRVRQFVLAYQSPEVEAAALKAFKGGAIRGW